MSAVSSRTDTAAAAPYLAEAEQVLAGLGSDQERGLSAEEARSRLASYGPNEITGEKPPSMVAVAL